MPKAIPNPESQWMRGARHQGRHEANGKQVKPRETSTRTADPAPLEEVEKERLAGEERGFPHLLQAEAVALAGSDSDLDQLRAENAQLRSIIAELQPLAEEAIQHGDKTGEERQKEYEALLEEKSEIIRTLHLKIQELQQQQPPAPATPKEEELLAMNEELERERNQIQRERRQLEEDLKQFKDDEDAMTKQMREMEVQMARERAELARQRNDVQRLLDEVRHELERHERDRGLNDKLGQLRRRYQDASVRQGPSPSSVDASANAGDQKEAAPPAKKENGFISRFFGQGK